MLGCCKDIEMFRHEMKERDCLSLTPAKENRCNSDRAFCSLDSPPLGRENACATDKDEDDDDDGGGAGGSEEAGS